jgi:hypothetical protein
MKKLLLFTFLFVNIQLFAQNKSEFFREISFDTASIEKLSLKAMYYGVYTFHPGFKVGIEYPIKRKNKEISRKPLFAKMGFMMSNKTKIIHKDWILSANFASYYHKQNHSAMLLTTELARRRTGRRGFYREFSFGYGIMKTFQPTTYEMNSSGEFEKVFMPGHFHNVINFGFALGKDYSIKNKPITWYFKPTFFVMFPYNSLLGVSSAFEIGITYKLFSNPFKK